MFGEVHLWRHPNQGFFCCCWEVFDYCFNLLIILFRFSISSWISCGRLNVTKNLSISSRFFNFLVCNCFLWPSIILFCGVICNISSLIYNFILFFCLFTLLWLRAILNNSKLSQANTFIKYNRNKLMDKLNYKTTDNTPGFVLLYPINMKLLCQIAVTAFTCLVSNSVLNLLSLWRATNRLHVSLKHWGRVLSSEPWLQ